MIQKKEHDARLKLYNQGLSDVEMGRFLFLAPSILRYWRQRNGLPPNLKFPRLTKAEQKTIWKMYREGKSDCAIGREIGRPASTICDWRKRNKLHTNYRRGQK